MKVSDVMTSDVVTVQPETPLKVVAQTLIEHRISGVPVVTSDGAVVGVISESDLIFKERGLIPGRTGLFARLVRSATWEDRSKVNARRRRGNAVARREDVARQSRNRARAGGGAGAGNPLHR